MFRDASIRYRVISCRRPFSIDRSLFSLESTNHLDATIMPPTTATITGGTNSLTHVVSLWLVIFLTFIWPDFSAQPSGATVPHPCLHPLRFGFALVQPGAPRQTLHQAALLSGQVNRLQPAVFQGDLKLFHTQSTNRSAGINGFRLHGRSEQHFAVEVVQELQALELGKDDQRGSIGYDHAVSLRRQAITTIVS